MRKTSCWIIEYKNLYWTGTKWNRNREDAKQYPTSAAAWQTVDLMDPAGSWSEAASIEEVA